ncbi:NAD(P)-binding protein [Zhongshania sp.]|jgi:ferredoxin--NADP+ reductase|uniref:NAD(P)-binding protein n=1 Tax=Zhongshania sp. TaxID=1971902 RepID=UPI002A835CB8|nr:NAD(P)-binding protein [Zhongshania sp.]
MTDNKMYKVAIVGSGPSGFYAAEALLKSELNIYVDVFERLPAPFGLVRYGVAPDHPKLKKPINIYETIAAHERFRLLANVEIGRDLAVEDLKKFYDVVIYSCGAQTDRKMDIVGEGIFGSYSSAEFVGWYNGHPDYYGRKFNLEGQSAVIIGQGNVAADLTRMLLKEEEDLSDTDICGYALSCLKNSNIKHVHVVGRRGPAQSKFGNNELRELGKLENVKVIINEHDLIINDATQRELNDRKNISAKKNVELFSAMTQQSEMDSDKFLHIHFYADPYEILGEERVSGIRFRKTELRGEAFAQYSQSLNEFFDIPCDLVFSSIGYKGKPVKNLPFDEVKGVIPNVQGRVDGVDGTFVTGWIKRGPSGTIGSNRACALETVALAEKDMHEGLTDCALRSADILDKLIYQGVRVLEFSDWKQIDGAEIIRGELVGKPREKFTTIKDMLSCIV